MNLKFKSTKEQLPKDGEYIFYIKNDRSLYYEDSPIPTFAKCEWTWEDGEGSQLSHDNYANLDNPPEDYPYLTILDAEGFSIWTNYTNKNNPEIEHFWWMPQKELTSEWKKNKQ